MKARIAFSTLSIALAGCLINLSIVAAARAQTSLPPSSGADTAPLPAGFSLTDSDTAEGEDEVTQKAINYLENHDYNDLDAYASELRNSRESWATGHWKLGTLYAGFSSTLEYVDAPDSDWESRLADLRDWVKTKPDSVTARIALAYTLNCYGWKARGNGRASTTSAVRWQSFHDRLAEAGAVLDGAEKLKEKCPVYWSVRMMIALGTGPPDRKHFDEIFKQATNAAPYYYDAYYYRRAVYLLPRWYGQPGEWETDLAKEADQIGGDKGDEIYAQVAWCINESVSPNYMFSKYFLSWPRVDRGFAVIEKEYPNSIAAKNERAYLAVLALDRPSTAKYLDQMDGQVDIQTWHTQDYFIKVYRWAYPFMR